MASKKKNFYLITDLCVEEVGLRIPYLEIIEPAEDKMDRTPSQGTGFTSLWVKHAKKQPRPDHQNT